MNSENDIIELGSVNEETRGQALAGMEDTATGLKIFYSGIQAQD